MATNEATAEATAEARQKAMDEATTDKLDDASPPNSPEIDSQETPEYRADIRPGEWSVPPSQWKINDIIYLRLKEGRTGGPFSIVFCHPPKNKYDKWRYDIRDASGKTKKNISGSLLI